MSALRANLNFIFFALGSLLVYFFSLKSPAFVSGRHAFIAPPSEMKVFTLGYKEVVSDILWLRLVQDIDHCDPWYINNEPEIGKNSKICVVDRGWSFQMLDAITSLTPKFRSPYSYGATILSVIANDKKGAALLFDRGVENFPSDWPILYRASYHFLIEMNEPAKAANLLVRAGRAGAPAWVYSLAAKLYSEDGKIELARSILGQMIEEDPEARYAERLRARLAEIESRGPPLSSSPALPSIPKK